MVHTMTPKKPCKGPRHLLSSPCRDVISVKSLAKRLEPRQGILLELLTRLDRDGVGYDAEPIVLEVREPSWFGSVYCHCRKSVATILLGEVTV